MIPNNCHLLKTFLVIYGCWYNHLARSRRSQFRDLRRFRLNHRFYYTNWLQRLNTNSVGSFGSLITFTTFHFNLIVLVRFTFNCSDILYYPLHTYYLTHNLLFFFLLSISIKKNCIDGQSLLCDTHASHDNRDIKEKP